MEERVSIQDQTDKTERRDLLSHTEQPHEVPPTDFSQAHISSLQRTIGNRALYGLFRAAVLQPKLKVGRPDDVYEQEADRVAEHVLDSSGTEAASKIVNQSGEMISLQEEKPGAGPDQPEEKQNTSYGEKESPLWAVPLKDRLTYDSDFSMFDDTAGTYDKAQMNAYAAEAQREKEFNEKLIPILERKLQELDQLGEVELSKQSGPQLVHEAVFEVLQFCVALEGEWVGGGTNVLNPYAHDFCGITINLQGNPFLLFPIWQHERTHQKHCLAAMKESKSRHKLEAQVAAANKFTNAKIWIASEIAAYRVSAEEIGKEIETYRNGSYEIIGASPMCIDEQPPVQNDSNTDVCIQKMEQQGGRSSPTMARESTIRSMQGKGRPLPGSVRSYFEPRFGRDFGDVRVHTDAKAGESARAINAKAFTIGRDIVFGDNQYAPETNNGRQLLAHELTHVVQQDSTHNESVQRQTSDEPADEKIKRIIMDEDDDAIVMLTDDDLSASTAAQRAGMIRILTDLTWTSESEERATLRLLKAKGQHVEVLSYLDSLGYRQKVIDSVDNETPHKELLDLLSEVQVQKAGEDAISKAISSGKPDDVMSIRDFSMAGNAQRIGLLQIMLDMHSSNAAEESKILDILESAGMGSQLKSLMDQVKELGLKQSLFDHIDDDSNKMRLTILLTSLNESELMKDLEVFNRSFFGNLWEGISEGFFSAVKNFSIGKMIMGLLKPILHPLESIIELIAQFTKLLERPSWDHFLTFGRDLIGFLAVWFTLLSVIVSGLAIGGLLIAVLLLAGEVTAPLGIIVGFVALKLLLIAGSLWTITTVLGILFVVFAILKSVVDAIQAGSATTARELEREEQQIGEDLTLLGVIAALWLIFKGFGRITKALKRNATEPEAAEPGTLKETADEAKSTADETTKTSNDLYDKTSEAQQAPAQEPVSPKEGPVPGEPTPPEAPGRGPRPEPPETAAPPTAPEPSAAAPLKLELPTPPVLPVSEPSKATVPPEVKIPPETKPEVKHELKPKSEVPFEFMAWAQRLIESIFKKLGGTRTGYKIKICDDTTVIETETGFTNIGLQTRFLGGAHVDPTTKTIWVHESIVREKGLVRSWGSTINLPQVIAHEIGHIFSNSISCARASRAGADLPGLTAAERVGLLDDAVHIASKEGVPQADLNLPPDYQPPSPPKAP